MGNDILTFVQDEFLTQLEAVIKQYVDTEAEIPKLCTEIAVLENTLGRDQPWPLIDVLRKLTEGCDILFNTCNYDGHGWEEISGCRERARDYVKRLECL